MLLKVGGGGGGGGGGGLKPPYISAPGNVLGNVYLISIDSGGGGALSHGAGHDGSFLRIYAVG